MQRLAAALSLAALAALAPGATWAADPHVVTPQDQVKWAPGPPTLPRGSEVALLAGDPGKAEEFALRLRFPDGFKVPAHWHTKAEQVTVLSGNLQLGMGDRAETAEATTLGPGGYAMLPGGMRHYALCKGGCVLQVQGTGPFDVHYVNPADNPQGQASR